uniref:Uncharacterized protein n=1 Tax=Timema tahoe TaxID=61484 RepID=A0A7R9FM11_9NEOP|nr:unnamed protein product [Timema tahoe]
MEPPCKPVTQLEKSSGEKRRRDERYSSYRRGGEMRDTVVTEEEKRRRDERYSRYRRGGEMRDTVDTEEEKRRRDERYSSYRRGGEMRDTVVTEQKRRPKPQFFHSLIIGPLEIELTPFQKYLEETRIELGTSGSVARNSDQKTTEALCLRTHSPFYKSHNSAFGNTHRQCACAENSRLAVRKHQSSIVLDVVCGNEGGGGSILPLFTFCVNASHWSSGRLSRSKLLQSTPLSSIHLIRGLPIGPLLLSSSALVTSPNHYNLFVPHPVSPRIAALVLLVVEARSHNNPSDCIFHTFSILCTSSFSQQLPDNVSPTALILEFNNYNVGTMPRGYFQQFTDNPLMISLYNCGIESLPDDMLRLSTNIIELHLIKNKLTTIPERFFDNNSKLKSIYLKYNLIEDLPQEIFYNLLELKKLDLSHNKLTANINLEELRLDNNQLQDLNSDIFNNISKLINLHLHNNKLSHLPADLFKDTHQLADISLHGNKLVTLEYCVFRNLRQLRNLTLSNNNISVVDYEIIHLYSLETIDLSNNPIKFIRGHFRNTSTKSSILKFKHIHQTVQINDITNPNESTQQFANNTINFPAALPSNAPGNDMGLTTLGNNMGLTTPGNDIKLALTYLNLSQVSLDNLNNIWFTSFVFLETLDLSRNKLTALGPNDFVSCRKLYSLNVSHNLLRTIHDDSFDSLIGLRVLDLSYNPSVDYSARIFKHTKGLNDVNLVSTGLTARKLTIMNEIFDLPEVPFKRLDNNPVCNRRYVETFLVLFFKVYNGEYYRYAMKGYHSCEGTGTNTQRETSLNETNNEASYDAVYTYHGTQMQPVFNCFYPCVCLDREKKEVPVRVCTYHDVKCKSIQELPSRLDPH